MAKKSNNKKIRFWQIKVHARRSRKSNKKNEIKEYKMNIEEKFKRMTIRKIMTTKMNIITKT